MQAKDLFFAQAVLERSYCIRYWSRSLWTQGVKVCTNVWLCAQCGGVLREISMCKWADMFVIGWCVLLSGNLFLLINKRKIQQYAPGFWQWNNECNEVRNNLETSWSSACVIIQCRLDVHEVCASPIPTQFTEQQRHNHLDTCSCHLHTIMRKVTSFWDALL